jgi:hypothetical protein
MDGPTFAKFLDHFDSHIVTEIPVVLLIDIPRSKNKED